jgi:hypothetical protein
MALKVTINTTPEPKTPTGEWTEVYKGKSGWRWRSWKNGRNVANAGEDYGKDRAKAVRAAYKFSTSFNIYVAAGAADNTFFHAYVTSK